MLNITRYYTFTVAFPDSICWFDCYRYTYADRFELTITVSHVDSEPVFQCKRHIDSLTS